MNPGDCLITLALMMMWKGLPVSGIGSPFKETGSAYYYTFWRAVNNRLMPKTVQITESVKHVLLDYCFQQQFSNMSCFEAAREEYDHMKVPPFPSNKTLQKELCSSQRPFIKSLLKETTIELGGFVRQLDNDYSKHCKESKVKLHESICTGMALVSANLKALASDLRIQIQSYFGASFGKSPKKSVLEKSLLRYRRPRIKRTFGLLYGLLSQLHETHSALQFSLQFSKPEHS